MKRNRIRLLCVVSDLHSGSTVALMPPGFVTKEGQTVEPSPLQLFFWQCWQRATQWVQSVADGDPIALILNGDLTEGNHHHTKQIISPSLTDHVECAAQLLRPLSAIADKTFLTVGTECHVGDTEAYLGKTLGAEVCPETGRHVFERLTLDVCGVRLVARHHVSTTSRPWLESNGLGMELGAEQLNAVRNGEPLPRILCVAHRHVPGHIATADGICLATPAWQGPTVHTHNKVPSARCRPGLYLLDWRGLPDGSLPTIHRRIYEAPHSKAVAL